MFENLSGESLKEEFKNNKTARTVTFAIAGVLVLVLGYLVYINLIWGPGNEDSKEAGYIGLNYADMDSTELAIEELSATVKKFDGKQGGETAQFVLARQYMNQGEFDMAMKTLKDVDVKDTYVKVHVVGLQGDCLSELKNYEEAVKTYIKAAELDDNDYTTPMYLFKAGKLLEKQLENPTKAAEVYTRIKHNYAVFANANQIDRFIQRASLKTKK